MKVTLGRDSSGRPLVLDRSVVAMLHEAGRLLGFELTVVQGSYMAGRGATASATTHNAAGVVDIRVAWGLPKSMTPEHVNVVLRKVGFASWVRDDQHGGMDLHIHAVAIHVQGKDPAAAKQVTQYLDGYDGLASNNGKGPDYNRRPAVIRTWPQYKKHVKVRRFLRQHPALMARVNDETRLRRFLRRHPVIAKQWLALGGHS